MSFTVFQLPEELMIYNASEIHAELVKVISDASSISLNGKNVEEIDGSGVQLLLWSRIECLKQDKEWELVEASEEISRCFDLLRLSTADLTQEGAL